jgi:hypothetical protein
MITLLVIVVVIVVIVYGNRQQATWKFIGRCRFAADWTQIRRKIHASEPGISCRERAAIERQRETLAWENAPKFLETLQKRMKFEHFRGSNSIFFIFTDFNT